MGDTKPGRGPKKKSPKKPTVEASKELAPKIKN